MHPNLRLSNLDKLPISARRTATAVCALHPSTADIDRLARFLEANPGQNVHFLPVHYTLIHPIRIPTTEQLDSGFEEIISTVYAASLSVKSLFGAKVPPETVMVVRAWACLVKSYAHTASIPKSGFYIVHQFLTQGIVVLEDMIAGAGGCIDDLARLVMMHLDLVAATEDEPLSPDTAWHLQIQPGISRLCLISRSSRVASPLSNRNRNPHRLLREVSV
ncbi:hypothetical protein DFH06DRAFT_1479103 [Mycena polygramma]|nr:hypothetical protein DFH06DRAFT_1479103 [Mycena polygramma]